MKKAVLFFSLIMFIICFVSCKSESGSNDGSNGGSNGASNADGKISEIQIVHNDVPNDIVSDIMEFVFDKTNICPTICNDTTAKSGVEIVIGESERSISKKAYQHLSRIDKQDEDLCYYLIYASDNSIAIAYENDKYGSKAAVTVAKDYFIDSFFKNTESIVSANGVVHQAYVDPILWQKDKDAKAIEEAWDALAESIGGELGEEIVSESKKYYTLISSDIVKWMANLYDTETGGFYYSNSARNTIGYAPDVESTFQILEFLSETGVFSGIDNDPTKLPESMKKQLVNWIKPMQNENGYFYHPQWTKEAVDRQLSRRGRDLKYAVQILSWCNAFPTYDTPDGVKGDYKTADGTPIENETAPTTSIYLTERFVDKSLVLAVSEVLRSNTVATASNVPSIMENAESFRQYLNTLNIRENAYEVGNELSSQAGQIKYRDKKLTEAGEDSLVAVLESWLVANQNPENGSWYFVSKSSPNYSYYTAVNDFLKISSLCNSVGIRINYVDAAIDTAIEGILSEEEIGTACHPYNPWFAINNIFTNLTDFSTDKKETERKILEIRQRLLEDAPEAIRKTYEKVLVLLKEDGTFSYFPNEYKGVSQGMSVSVPGVAEGDVNATIICAYRTPDMMFEALGIKAPLAFGLSEWYLFCDLMEEMGPVIKDVFVEREEPITFDDDGELSSEISFVTASNGSFKVERDPRENRKGNILAFRSVPGGTDNLYVYSESTVIAPCYIFETDMSISAASTGNIASVYIDQCYMIAMRVEGGRVYFYDSSSDRTPKKDVELGASVALDEWFNFKIEYYSGTHDTVRAKMYINDKLISVSDNYFDREGEKLTNGSSIPSAVYSYARIIAFKNADISILLDDVIVRKSYKKYTPASDPNNQPAYNVDPPEKDQIKYDFENLESDNCYPDDFTVTKGEGLATLVEQISGGENNKLLKLNKGYGDEFDISIPVNVRTKFANNYVFSADLILQSENEGEIFDISWRSTGGDAITIIRAAIISENSKKYLAFYNASSGISDGLIKGVKIQLESGFTLRTEFYPENKTTLFYVNGIAVAVSNSICSNSDGLTVSELNISSVKDSAFVLCVDNILAEYNESSFENAVNQSEIKIYDFETDSLGVETNGEIKKDKNGNSYLNLGQNEKASVQLKKTTPFVNAYVTKFGIGSVYSNTEFSLEFKDEKDETVLKYIFVISNKTLYIYENTAAKRYEIPLASIGIDEWIDIELQSYPQIGTTLMYVGEKCIAISDILYSSYADGFDVSELIITSAYGVALDDISASAANKIYESPTISDVSNVEDGEDSLEFEGSSTGSLPSALSFNTITGRLGIVERNNGGTASKWLSFRSYKGSYDKILFSVSNADSKLNENNTAVFESDIYIENKSLTTPTYEIYLSDSNGTNAYLLLFRLNGNNIQIRDISGESDIAVPGRILGEWTNTEATVSDDCFNLRIEYTFGDSDNVKIVTYINNKVALVSNNFYGKSTIESSSPASRIDSACVCAYKATEAVMYFDNVALTYKTVIEKEPQKTYDFEDGVIPQEYFSLNTSTNGVNASMTVVKDNDTENGSNVIAYSSNSSSPASRFIVGSCFEENGADTYVFESDIKCDFGSKNYFYIDLMNGTKTVYSLVFKKTSSGIQFYDVATSSDTSSPYGSVSVEDGWFNLRIEYYPANGNKDELTFRTYVNGVLVYESNNYYASGENYLEKVDNAVIRCYKTATTVIYLDDIGFYSEKRVS